MYNKTDKTIVNILLIEVYNKIMEESQCKSIITTMLNMVHRVNHDTDNAQHRLLTI